jgi:murein DD-endopeptidase MepM/ murein hydrolase activator NlpD
MARHLGGHGDIGVAGKGECTTLGTSFCLLIIAMAALSGCLNTGSVATSTIPAQGGTMELKGFATAAFPSGAFNNPQSVTLERANEADFNATAELFSLEQWTDEVIISTGSRAPLADTVVAIALPENFTNKLDGNSKVQAFVRIFQDNGYDFIDAFEPVASTSNSTTVEITLPKEAFVNTRNAKGDYEAAVMVASMESGAGAAAPNAQADNSRCKAAFVGSPLRGNLVIANGSDGETVYFGVDLKAKLEDQVFPVAPGTVVAIGFDENATQYPTQLQTNRYSRKTGWGQYVMIRNDDGATVLYAHLMKNSPQSLGLKIGQKASTCNPIGTVGSTGGAAGPYLHLEYVVNGTEIDPWPCIDKGFNLCKAPVFCESWQTFNKTTGKCDLDRGYCNSNKDCKRGQECGVNAHQCQNAEGIPKMSGGERSCPPGFMLGQDSLCHAECGTSYCTNNQQCYSSQCLSCSQGYLLSDGICYSDNTGNTACPDGYAVGQDGSCQEQCGQTACPADAWCYDGVCVACQAGQYLGTDGYCHKEGDSQQGCPNGYVMDDAGQCQPENGNEDYQCPPGEVPGNDYYCHEQCGTGYCEGDAQCYYGKCLSCESGYYLGTDGRCHPENGNGDQCPDGDVLGSDGLCHMQCGTGYCEGNQECYNGKCVYCFPGYYLAEDGNCYFDNGGQTDGCGQGYALGADGFCHEACGNGYCLGDAQCYNGQCVGCQYGYYLGTDGRCHPENGNKCEIGNVLGEDGLCHMACGDTYCVGDEECWADECRSCGAGEIMGVDGQCHEACGDGYCGSDAVCVDGEQCIGCNAGYVLGTDGQCHEQCGNGYCLGDSKCVNGQCSGCIEGDVLGTDGQCHEACGDTYCTGDKTCINGECSDCIPGFVLGGNGQCYEICGNGYCSPSEVCEDGACVNPNECDPGQILGDDGECHEACGSAYCTGDTICDLGQCVPNCQQGEVLGSDGECHEACGDTYCTGTDQCTNGQCQPGCPEGQVMGSDGGCHEQCGSSYCIGDTACENGQCVPNCPEGEILGGNGICYPGCPLGSFQASDSLCCANGYHQVTSTGCCPNGMDLSNDPQVCCPSGDYYTGFGLWCCPYGTNYVDGKCENPQQQGGSSDQGTG